MYIFVDMPGREAEFESKAGAFEHQANQIANTAIQLANAGGNTNKRLLDQIRQNAEEVSITEIHCLLAVGTKLIMQHDATLLAVKSQCVSDTPDSFST